MNPFMQEVKTHGPGNAPAETETFEAAEGEPVATVDARVVAEHRLHSAVRDWLSHDETKPLVALVYRELARAVEAAGRELARGYGKSEGVLAWHSSAGQLCWVALLCYSRKSFRLSTTHTLFYYDKPQPPAPYPFEVSFAPAEVAQIAKGFVRFTESAFESGGDREKVWPWPLFREWGARGYDYVWTRTGSEREALANAAKELGE